MEEKKKAANVKVPEKDRKVHMFIYLFTVKFRKLAPRLIFFKDPFRGAYFWRGLYSEGFTVSKEGNLRFKTDWASLIVGSEFTVFALFYLGQFSKYKPLVGLY